MVPNFSLLVNLLHNYIKTISTIKPERKKGNKVCERVKEREREREKERERECV